jgi:hypothetical protein
VIGSGDVDLNEREQAVLRGIVARPAKQTDSH